MNASITNYKEIISAFEGIEVVVHLAAFRSDDPVSELIRTNIDGTYNVFKASVDSGVRRVVFASSAGVVRGYLKDGATPATDSLNIPKIIDAKSAPRPVRPYDATKVAGESIGSIFHENFGIETVCVRVGKCTTDDVPPESPVRPFWVSQRDVTQLLAGCVEHTPSLGYELLYGTSANDPPVVDIKHAADVLGYKPLDGCKWRPTRSAFA